MQRHNLWEINVLTARGATILMIHITNSSGFYMLLTLTPIDLFSVIIVQLP